MNQEQIERIWEGFKIILFLYIQSQILLGGALVKVRVALVLEGNICNRIDLWAGPLAPNFVLCYDGDKVFTSFWNSAFTLPWNPK